MRDNTENTATSVDSSPGLSALRALGTHLIRFREIISGARGG